MKKKYRIVRKYVEYIITRGALFLKERVFNYEEIRLKYILRRNKQSNILVVVFSACTRKGLKARYNYYRSLASVSCNQLFILDDFADDHRGSYYMGDNRSFSEEKSTIALIHKVQKEVKGTRVILCGSSKGGYAALNFGLQIPNSIIISGGPQYYLDTYLRKSDNIDCLFHIVGSLKEEDTIFLDSYLKNRITQNKYIDTQVIYLHYSINDHTYTEHIQFLLSDLEHNGYTVLSDVAEYTNHSDISLYFPDFLVNTINSIINS